MRRFGQAVVGLIVVAFAAINIAYWLDPWLWRGYTKAFLLPIDRRAEARLPPDEQIRGDGLYVLPVAGPDARTIAAAALSEMDRYAAEFESYALIVVRNGVIEHEWYAPDWSAEKITQSQSMHKTLQALLVGIAIDDGMIGGADDPVARYIGEWRDDPRGAITLRQLMQMSSGLTEPRFSPNPFSDGVKWLYSGHSEDTILATPMDTWQPGSQYRYNNLNSELLGMIIARAYGKRYAKILEEKIWQPMGGTRAFVHTDRPGGRAYTSCCLGAPAMDWVRIGMLMLGRGEVNGRRIVSPEWIDDMTTPSPAARHYGLQTWLGYDDPPIPEGAVSTGMIAAEPFLARDTFHLLGRGQQHVWVVPSHNMVIVRLGPWAGRMPIKPGFDVTYFVNAAIRGLTASNND